MRLARALTTPVLCAPTFYFAVRSLAEVLQTVEQELCAWKSAPARACALPAASPFRARNSPMLSRGPPWRMR